MSTVELATNMPPPREVWQYKWAVTLTIREDDPTQVRERHLVAECVDDLVDLVLHHSLDPRIAAYTYHRFAALDMSAAPRCCRECGEPYRSLMPGQAWRTTQQCSCGGHAVFSCTVCGTNQAYPRVDPTCVVNRNFPLSPPNDTRQGDPKRRRGHMIGLRRWLGSVTQL